MLESSKHCFCIRLLAIHVFFYKMLVSYDDFYQLCKEQSKLCEDSLPITDDLT